MSKRGGILLVTRTTLRKKTTLSEQQIQSLITLALRFEFVCGYHTVTGKDSRGYIAPMGRFNIALLAEFFQKRTVLPNTAKRQNAANALIQKVCEQIKNDKN